MSTVLTGSSLALVALAAYTYLKLAPPPNPMEEGEEPKAKTADVFRDTENSSLRFLNRANVHPNEWHNLMDVSAPRRYIQDTWKRDDGAYNPAYLHLNPQRRRQQRMATGGMIGRPNFRADPRYGWQPRGTSIF